MAVACSIDGEFLFFSVDSLNLVRVVEQFAVRIMYFSNYIVEGLRSTIDWDDAISLRCLYLLHLICSLIWE